MRGYTFKPLGLSQLALYLSFKSTGVSSLPKALEGIREEGPGGMVFERPLSLLHHQAFSSSIVLVTNSLLKNGHPWSALSVFLSFLLETGSHDVVLTGLGPTEIQLPLLP